MPLTRRNLLAAGLAAPAAAAFARPKMVTEKALRAMLIIDGLGGLTDPYSPDGEMRLSARAVAEMKASGVDAINVTVGPVGNGPSVWDETLSSIAFYHKVIATNPDSLIAIRDLADFSLAKAQGRLGIYFGTQDTSMISTQLIVWQSLKPGAFGKSS